MKALFPAALLLCLSACGGAGGTPSEGQVVNSTATATTPSMLDLVKYDTPLLIELGDMVTLGVDSPTVKWNEEFGRLEVSAGDHFGLLITEEPGDLARLKADLERDMLRKHTVLEETPEKLVYRSEFPDEAGTFIHFYRTVQVGDRSFVVTDMEQKRYNEADVQRMVNAINVRGAV